MIRFSLYGDIHQKTILLQANMHTDTQYTLNIILWRKCDFLPYQTV